MTPDSYLAPLRERLDNLERQNRRLQGAVALALVAGAAGLLLGARPAALATDKSRAVEAERFILRDAQGKRRAELTVQGDEAFLLLAGADENPRVRLTAKPPGLVLTDEGGNVAAYLYQLGYGAGLDVRDGKGRIRAALGVRKEGPVLQLLDDKDKPIFTKP